MDSLVRDKIAWDIWSFLSHHGFWITVSHLSGLRNFQADSASRTFNKFTEYTISDDLFQTLNSLFGPFDIDLFASYLNFKVKPYVSWGPDPFSQFVDAFTIPWNFSNPFVHAPYSVIYKCLQKIQEEQVDLVTMLIPNWPSQPWFPIMLGLLIAYPIFIQKLHLFLPWDPTTISSLSN